MLFDDNNGFEKALIFDLAKRKSKQNIQNSAKYRHIEFQYHMNLNFVHDQMLNWYYEQSNCMVYYPLHDFLFTYMKKGNKEAFFSESTKNNWYEVKTKIV